MPKIKWSDVEASTPLGPMAGPLPANPQQGQTTGTAQDLLEAALPSAFRGMNTIAGLGGDIGEKTRLGLDWLGGAGTGEQLLGKRTTPTSQEYQDAFEKYLGFKLYKPETPIGKLGAETIESAYAGGAFAPEPLGATLVPAVLGQGAEAIGEKIAGGPGTLSTTLGTVARILAPYVWHKGANATRALANSLMGKNLNQQQVLSLADDAYNKAKKTTTFIDRSAFSTMSDDMASLDAQFPTEQHDPIVKKVMTEMVDTVANGDKPISGKMFLDWRSRIGKQAGKGSAEAKAAYAMLMDWVENDLPGKLSGEGSDVFIAQVKAGDTYYKRWLAGGLLERGKDIARGEPSYSKSLSTQYKGIRKRGLPNPGHRPTLEQRVISPYVSREIQSFTHGSLPEKAVATVAGLAPTKNPLTWIGPGIFSGGGVLGAGGPQGLAAGAAAAGLGYGAKAGLAAEQIYRANQIANMARLGLTELNPSWAYPINILPNMFPRREG